MLGASKHPKPPTRHPRESLAQLRAELEYLEGLDRKPTSYRLPPGDAELSLQILRFYDYTSAALEPQVLDFYVSAGGSKRRMRDIRLYQITTVPSLQPVAPKPVLLASAPVS